MEGVSRFPTDKYRSHCFIHRPESEVYVYFMFIYRYIFYVYCIDNITSAVILAYRLHCPGKEDLLSLCLVLSHPNVVNHHLVNLETHAAHLQYETEMGTKKLIA
eukprot:TRINITY_DN532_c0_g1_i5.p2 TRINITY_DN532_c0_g1~~TRINITY_DN532_c0_g1_i5.p2  ORF type:complete len:104 (-),score=1.23 TRINITY_DN532_c0_g1_i5:507-818(-)